MPKKLSDDDLLAVVAAEVRQSVGYWAGKLAFQRQQAMYYYYGEAKDDLAPPEIEGRSKVISPDVRNTIESMLPQLMVKFAGSENTIEFEPVKPGDEPKAEQATDYINHLYSVKNRGEVITYTAIKDALLSKAGFVKVWWDERKEEKREEYEGLTQFELADVLGDDEVEVIEHRKYADPVDLEQRQKAVEQLTEQLQQVQQRAQQMATASQPMGAPQAPGQPTGPSPLQQAQAAVQQITQQISAIKSAPPVYAYDISVRRTNAAGRLRVENVPPEEFLISRKAKSIADAPFVGHRVARTIGELRSLGYQDVENLGGDDNATAMNMERIERLSFDDEMAYVPLGDQQSIDDSQRIVYVIEGYLRCDADGDGIVELVKIVTAGNRILEKEVVEEAPFIKLECLPLPHKFFGLSAADLALESQKSKTGILRALLDNMYLQVNGRNFAVDGQVNLDDLLASRPGGVVRIKQPGAVGRLDQGMGDMAGAMSMLEYMDSFTENSTGWTRYSQGMDGDSLNQTATGVTQITARADMRLDLMARNLAQGFKDLFRMMLRIVSQHQRRKDVVRLRGTWVEVDPRDWRNGFETTINVGLGTGNKDQLVAHLMALNQQQQLGLQIGTALPQNVYALQKKMAEAMGFKSGDLYFTDPSNVPPKPAPPLPEQIKAQTALQIKQMDLQADAQKFQADTQVKMQALSQQHQQRMAELQREFDIQSANDHRDSEREALQAELKAQREAAAAQADSALKQLQLEVDKYKADLQSQTQLAIAGMSAAPAVDLGPLQQQLQQLVEHVNAPAELVYDQTTGRATGVKKGDTVKQIKRDQTGRAIGLQ